VCVMATESLNGILESGCEYDIITTVVRWQLCMSNTILHLNIMIYLYRRTALTVFECNYCGLILTPRRIVII